MATIHLETDQLNSDRRAIENALREGTARLIADTQKKVAQLERSFKGEAGESVRERYAEFKQQITQSIDKLNNEYSTMIQRAAQQIQDADRRV